MNDYRLIEEQIRRARLARSAYLGQLVTHDADALWTGVKRLVNNVMLIIRARIEAVDQPKTLPPAYF
ncbi:MAG: hypothetical protein ABI790_15055 [Betaproteobacteria bacterium]